jgi:hypothetical protein
MSENKPKCCGRCYYYSGAAAACMVRLERCWFGRMPCQDYRHWVDEAAEPPDGTRDERC